MTKEQRFAEQAGIPWSEVESGADGSAWIWYHPDGRHFAAINEHGVAWYTQHLDADGNVLGTEGCRAPRGFRSI